MSVYMVVDKSKMNGSHDLLPLSPTQLRFAVDPKNSE